MRAVSVCYEQITLQANFCFVAADSGNSTSKPGRINGFPSGPSSGSSTRLRPDRCGHRRARRYNSIDMNVFRSFWVAVGNKVLGTAVLTTAASQTHVNDVRKCRRSKLPDTSSLLSLEHADGITFDSTASRLASALFVAISLRHLQARYKQLNLRSISTLTILRRLPWVPLLYSTIVCRFDETAGEQMTSFPQTFNDQALDASSYQSHYRLQT